jgi:osmotically-inducible protein OsmY
MNALLKVGVIGLILVAFAPSAQAQTQSNSPADQAVSQKISKALVKAGIDPRTTSVQVITTSDHVVYLTGLISNKNTIKLAGDVAAKTAPSYRIVNNINSGFFDDPNHVNGGMSK